MSLQQISVFLENRAGELVSVTSALAEKNIDLRALHISETEDYGVLRLIASEWERAVSVLQENGIVVSLSPVIVVSVPDKPGGLNSLLSALSEENVNVSYMYSVFGRHDGSANMVFKVEDIENVEKMLTEKGFKIALLD